MRRMLCGLGALAALAAIASPAFAGGGRVAICHATGSATNPYVLISPAAAGIATAHMHHQEGRDVIPPFTFRGTTYSRNWDAAGATLYDGGCDGSRITDPGDGDGGGGDGGPSF